MSLRVVHSFGRNAGVVQTINKEVIRFGRAPDGDVVFDPNFDRDASARHAEVRREGSSWVLVDLGSRNGTFVGGQRISRHVLSTGDEIVFGQRGPRVRIEFSPAAVPVRPPMASAPVAMPAPVAVPAPLPPAPPAGKRVGQRTIAMMIASAVDAARGGGSKHSTQELSAYVDRQVNAATASHKRTTAVLTILLLVALSVLGGLIYWSTQSSDDIDKLRKELANLSPNDPRRKEIEGRLGTLHPSNASFGRNLYDRTKKGIFMLAAGGQGFCTAFAIRPNVLATNAHCILVAKRQGGRVVALENEGSGRISFSVSSMRAHPAYREADEQSLTPDVGIVTIDGRAATVLELATLQELTSVGAGDDIYLLGFPGRLMDANNPAATFLAAHIGRITNAQGRPSAFTDVWLIQHDASTSKGTSGSPIFNGRGKVVAINAGGYLEGESETIAGRKTEIVKASPYKFGMRIDLLNAILK